MRKTLCVMIVTGVLTAGGEAYAGLNEPIYAIDSPTAGILAHGEYLVQGRMGPESSFLIGVRVGFKSRIHVGVSFGLQNVISYEAVRSNDQPGFQVSLRLVEEARGPALAVGFNSQGVGIYDEAEERYERKSRGLYAVLSKNWSVWVGQFSLHGGVNYSFEDADGDDEPNVFAAAGWEVFHGLELLVDADAALNDNSRDGQFGGGGMYIDAAVRVTYGENLSLMLIFRDLSENYESQRRVGRELEISFVDLF
jgi:hypothetical protein